MKLKLVQLQTTSRCNGKCIMCPWVGSWFSKNAGVMSDELYNKILDDIVDFNPDFSGRFCPYLMNEPFMDKDFLKRVEQAINKLPRMKLEISSNFVLPKTKDINKLIRLWEKINFNGRMMISHHGTTKESYEKIMGLPWGHALNNIVYLIEKVDGKLNIFLHGATASRDNELTFQTGESYVDFWKTFFEDNNVKVRNVIMYPLQVHNRAGNVQLDSWKYNRTVRQIDPEHKFDCYRTYGCLHVLYTGEITLCCCDYNRDAIIGDLTKTNIKEFYASDIWKKTKDMVRGYEESPEDFICKRCQWPGG
jgi:MoaA/NifB/PqqE/SkfB family radical SAM enzyme